MGDCAATHCGTSPSSNSICDFWRNVRTMPCGARQTAATGASWPKARVTGLHHVKLDESCVRFRAVCDDSFLSCDQCCPVRQHLQVPAPVPANDVGRGREPLFLDQRDGPGRVDGGACGVGRRRKKELSTILVLRWGSGPQTIVSSCSSVGRVALSPATPCFGVVAVLDS